MPKEIKPGSLCLIKGTCYNDGKIVTVTAIHTPGYDYNNPFQGEVAEVDCPLSSYHPLFGFQDGCKSIPVCYLHPLNNPPDDAVDETLLWLPVPQEEREYEIFDN